MPRFERLEPRSLLAASLTPAAPPNETLDAAYELGHLSTGMEVEDYGSIGNGPAGGADVEWYTYTLDQPALMTAKLERQQNDSSFAGGPQSVQQRPQRLG